jgi:hypothetical protein
MKKTVWQNYEGVQVPESAISPYDKKKEPKMAQMLKKVQAAVKARDEAERFLRETGDVLVKELYTNKGQIFTENEGYTLYNYDKSVRLVARKNAVMQLSNEVNIANKLFNEYLDIVLTNDNKDIRVLVQRAFSTNKGELDPKKLLSLLSLKIEHPKWVEATNSLREAMSTNSTKRYFKLATRNSEGEYVDIW